MTAGSTGRLNRTPPSDRFTHVDQYLAIGQEAGASDVHLGVNAPPLWRLHGSLQTIWPDAPRLTSDNTITLSAGFLSAFHIYQIYKNVVHNITSVFFV